METNEKHYWTIQRGGGYKLVELVAKETAIIKQSASGLTACPGMAVMTVNGHLTEYPERVWETRQEALDFFSGLLKAEIADADYKLGLSTESAKKWRKEKKSLEQALASLLLEEQK